MELPEFEGRKAVQSNYAKLVQCCYNTDACSVFTRGSLDFDSEKCSTVPGFKEANSRLNLDELIIVYVCVIAVAKSVYGRLVRWISTGSKGSIQHVQPTTESADFPKRTFSIKPDPSWQYTASSIVAGTFAFSGYWLFRSAGKFAVDRKYLTVALIAAYFDVKAIITLLGQVLHLRLPWTKNKQAKVHIDLHPDRGSLGVEGKPPIPLAQIARIDLENRMFYVMLATSYVLAGFPLAVGSLALRSLKLSAGTEFVPTLVGALAMLRELFGLGVFARLNLSLFWIFSTKDEDRDDFGRSMMRDGLVQQCALWACLAPAIMFIHMARQVELVSTADGFFLFTISFVSGAVLSAVLGALRGLPVCTECILASWPGRTCFAISFEEKITCPCLFTLSFCGQLHSVQKLLVLTIDDYLFRDLLQGKAPAKKDGIDERCIGEMS